MEDVLREQASGTTYRYVHGGGIDEPLARVDQGGAAVFFHADHLGSIVKVTNSSGAVVTTRRYDPYGNLEAGASEAGYAFTGREWDPEAGLYFYRERWYDPKVGRFLSEDPLGLLEGPNAYAYVGDNPISRKDPSGMTWQDARTCGWNLFSCATANAPCYRMAEFVEDVLTKGQGSDNDRNNALKHCTWACCIASNSSWKMAIDFTDAHESDDRNKPEYACRSQMDRWNNRVGALLGERNRGGGGDTCLELCQKSPMLQCEPRKVPPIICQSGGF
jgi:RHS repeat-associated protein